jgi:hypothetical protein
MQRAESAADRALWAGHWFPLERHPFNVQHTPQP